MKRRFLFQVIIMAVVSMTITSCSSTKINSLEGQWQIFWIQDLETDDIYIWEFSADNVFTIKRYSPPTDSIPIPTTLITASYETRAEFTKAVVRIYDVVGQNSDAYNMLSLLDRATYDPSWEILVVDDEIMRLGTMIWADISFESLLAYSNFSSLALDG